MNELKLEIEKIFDKKYNLVIDIQNLVEEFDISYIDAVIMYAENNNIDVEVIGEFIKSIPSIQAEIQLEAENLNYIKKTSRLPI